MNFALPLLVPLQEVLAVLDKPLIKKYSVPFEIWNIGNENNQYQVNCILLDKNTNDVLDLGEEIRIVNSTISH